MIYVYRVELLVTDADKQETQLVLWPRVRAYNVIDAGVQAALSENAKHDDGQVVSKILSVAPAEQELDVGTASRLNRILAHLGERVGGVSDTTKGGGA